MGIVISKTYQQILILLAQESEMPEMSLLFLLPVYHLAV